MAPGALLQPYVPASVRSQLVSNPPSAIPSLEELRSLEQELRSLQTRAEKRQEKATNDCRTIELILRKLKDRERDVKGKAREVVKDIHLKDHLPSLSNEQKSKIRRDQTRTPDIDDSSSLLHPSLKSHPSKNKSSSDSKKKKRKREPGSDGEGRENHKIPKPSPAPAPEPTTKKISKPAPTQSSSSQIRLTSSGFRIAEDFSEPSTSTLPMRPIPSIVPPPGPTKPSEVMEDFSKAKAPTQTSITTFYAGIEPWIRPLREDELGLLEWDGDTVEPFLVPPLGQHYTDAWDEEDKASYGYSLMPQLNPLQPGPSTSSRLKHNAAWDPINITDTELGTDERGIGPLAERIVSALLPIKGGAKGDKDKDEGPSAVKISNIKMPTLNTMDLEERLKIELQTIGLPVESEAPFDATEDQILADLRRAQRVLRSQMLLNRARRMRLLAIAQDRLAYQEYLDTRDVLDRQISSIYSRQQKRDNAKSAALKKRKKPGSAAALAALEEKEKDREKTGLSPASLGLGVDEGGKLIVSEALMQAVRLRRQWVDVVGSTLAKKQADSPGRLWGLPSKSVFEGIEEDVKVLEEQGFGAEREGDG